MSLNTSQSATEPPASPRTAHEIIADMAPDVRAMADLAAGIQMMVRGARPGAPMADHEARAILAVADVFNAHAESVLEHCRAAADATVGATA